MKLGELVDAAALGARPCWRKERHATEGAAAAQLRSLQRRGVDGKFKDPESMNVYLCPWCRAWHVGHRSRGLGQEASDGGAERSGAA